jgi:TetR/AcrR family transcriptional regulator, transcriptional repressor for nem operon
VTNYVRSTVALLTKLVPGKFKAKRRHKAISTYATLVGAMVLARAVDDRVLSQEILEARPKTACATIDSQLRAIANHGRRP